MKASDTVLLSAAVVFFGLLTVGALVARHAVAAGEPAGRQQGVQAVDSAASPDPGFGVFGADSVRPTVPQQEQ